jgi:hypothetical protein
MTTLEELQAMRAELWGLEGRTFIQEINALTRTIRLFDGNTRELRRFLGKTAEPPQALHIAALRDRELDQFLDEVDRLLHNFVAAAISLRDHTRRIQAKFLPAVERDHEYDARVREAFRDAQISRFVTELRNYTTHARLPIARGHFHMDMAEQSFDATVALDAEDLLQRTNGPQARESSLNRGKVPSPLIRSLRSTAGASPSSMSGFVMRSSSGTGKRSKSSSRGRRKSLVAGEKPGASRHPGPMTSPRPQRRSSDSAGQPWASVGQARAVFSGFVR